jgi:hypothetical protein
MGDGVECFNGVCAVRTMAKEHGSVVVSMFISAQATIGDLELTVPGKDTLSLAAKMLTTWQAKDGSQIW